MELILGHPREWHVMKDDADGQRWLYSPDREVIHIPNKGTPIASFTLETSTEAIEEILWTLDHHYGAVD